MYFCLLGFAKIERKHFNFSESEIREAVQHALRVSREGSCKIPRPRVVQVKSIYPHPSKTYIPHCTILHQCGDDTGCCRHESLSCVPISTHRVELHFYVSTDAVL
ncbi:hypothetical protein J437_LFUL002558 [Ladona fulva]|uniref:Platelet-derived growth factor (PDGF) family profile domain-containing protein n=1 Tax=Ladona fulva TaxID=123851 RepID=A0A8K0JVJ5_LADFU|nr:hypothetical protein J437_LFUL002558 [Ladona fulva]